MYSKTAILAMCLVVNGWSSDMGSHSTVLKVYDYLYLMSPSKVLKLCMKAWLEVIES